MGRQTQGGARGLAWPWAMFFCPFRALVSEAASRPGSNPKQLKSPREREQQAGIILYRELDVQRQVHGPNACAGEDVEFSPGVSSVMCGGGSRDAANGRDQRTGLSGCWVKPFRL